MQTKASPDTGNTVLLPAYFLYLGVYLLIIKHTSGAMYVLRKGISTLISQVALAPMENLRLEHRIRSQKNADQDASAIWICISRR